MNTELIYSLKPIYVNLILNKEKKYEYRTIKPKNLPKRIWFYISSPEKSLKYLADVGEIIQTTDNEFAYPILHFYEIKEPISFKDLKGKFGFSAPQSFCYLKKYEKLHNYLLKEAIIEKIY